MEYTIYKLEFLNGAHFGNNTLESAQCTFQADTLFSALCIEAVKKHKNLLNQLVNYVENGELILSDAFPYIQDEYYIPKPFIHIENNSQGNSVIKKAYKQMEYIPLSGLDDFLRGTLPLEKTHELEQLGRSFSKVSVSVRGEEEPMPYRVGIYYYNNGCGLYLIVGHADIQVMEFFEELLEGVSFSGIGGKRNTGLGHFTYYKVKKMPAQLEDRLAKDKGTFMTLSVSLPAEHEIDKVLEQASYTLEKRSGFVDSTEYAQLQLRKKDLYVFKAGACVSTKYEGAVYDVAAGGKHAVYRYAKPLFMEVSP